jgi:hypothetical protein
VLTRDSNDVESGNESAVCSVAYGRGDCWRASVRSESCCSFCVCACESSGRPGDAEVIR